MQISTEFMRPEAALKSRNPGSQDLSMNFDEIRKGINKAETSRKKNQKSKFFSKSLELLN